MSSRIVNGPTRPPLAGETAIINTSTPGSGDSGRESARGGGVACGLAWDGNPVGAFTFLVQTKESQEYRLKLEGRVPASALEKAAILAVCFRFKDGFMLEKSLGAEGLAIDSIPRSNPDPSNNQPDRKTSGHSGGSGCNTGFAGLILLAALPIVLRGK